MCAQAALTFRLQLKECGGEDKDENCKVTCGFSASVTVWRSVLQVLSAIAAALALADDRFRTGAHGVKAKWAAFALGGFMFSMFAIDADRVQTGFDYCSEYVTKYVAVGKPDDYECARSSFIWLCIGDLVIAVSLLFLYYALRGAQGGATAAGPARWHKPRMWAMVAAGLSLLAVIVGAVQASNKIGGSDADERHKQGEMQKALDDIFCPLALAPFRWYYNDDPDRVSYTCGWPGAVTGWRMTVMVLALALALVSLLTAIGERHGGKVKWATCVVAFLVFIAASIDADRVQEGQEFCGLLLDRMGGSQADHWTCSRGTFVWLSFIDLAVSVVLFLMFFSLRAVQAGGGGGDGGGLSSRAEGEQVHPPVATPVKDDNFDLEVTEDGPGAAGGYSWGNASRDTLAQT